MNFLIYLAWIATAATAQTKEDSQPALIVRLMPEVSITEVLGALPKDIPVAHQELSKDLSIYRISVISQDTSTIEKNLHTLMEHLSKSRLVKYVEKDQIYHIDSEQ